MLSVHSLDEVENYWLELLHLNGNNLRKGSIVKEVPKVKRVKYPFGICTMMVHSTDLAQRIFGAIKKYGLIDQKLLWL